MLGREKLLQSLMGLSARSASRSRPELMDAALRHALLLAEAEGAVVSTAGGRQTERLALRPSDTAPETVALGTAPAEFMRTLLLSGVPRSVSDLAEAQRLGEGEGCPGVDAGPALFVPLRMREHESGYLAVYRARGAARFTGRDARSLALLVAWLATALDSIRLAENLEKLAVTDDLTQVYNYRYLKTALRREVKRATRFRQHLSLIMVDVDNLKAYNDRNGHLRGSHLLKEIAHCFTEQVRSWDLVAKYGGDEFTVILPQTDGPGALTVAERLRSSIATAQFPLAPRGSITISLGVATYPDDTEQGSGLIEAADRALYQAKRLGRNRVEVADRQAA